VALEDFNMSMQVTASRASGKPWFFVFDHQPGHAQRVVGDEAASPMSRCFSSTCVKRSGIAASGAVVMHEPLSNLARSSSFSSRAARRNRIWRGMQGARRCRRSAESVTVEDIAPENADAVFWSLAYRSNFMEDHGDGALSLQRPWTKVRSRRDGRHGCDATQRLRANMRAGFDRRGIQ